MTPSAGPGGGGGSLEGRPGGPGSTSLSPPRTPPHPPRPQSPAVMVGAGAASAPSSRVLLGPAHRSPGSSAAGTAWPRPAASSAVAPLSRETAPPLVRWPALCPCCPGLGQSGAHLPSSRQGCTRRDCGGTESCALQTHSRLPAWPPAATPDALGAPRNRRPPHPRASPPKDSRSLSHPPPQPPPQGS